MKINTQPIEKSQKSDGSTLDVHSIFYTIQGEGPYTGRPAVFVRLAGCNLQCPGCDTDYTSGRGQMNIGMIIDEICSTCTSIAIELKPIVVITGGEPFRQNIKKLIDELIELECIVQIETNGTLPPPEEFSPYCCVVCSPKAGKINPDLLYYIDCFKYVISHDSVSPADGLPILALGHSAAPKVARPPSDFCGTIYVQPMDSQDEKTNELNLKAAIKSCMTFGYTLQIQIHKIIGMA